MNRLYPVFFLLFAMIGETSQVPDFQNLSNTKGAVIFLSTKRSGSNLISASLSAITRKPVSWLYWKDQVFDPHSKVRNHPSYNRLALPLVTDQPFLYRTHFEFDKLKQIPSHSNLLIFVTRNPKELIFREFSLQTSNLEPLDLPFIEKFLENYLRAFEIYEDWSPENRKLVFYEDFIGQSNEILLQLLSFMGEEPLFFNDYEMHRQEYLNLLLESYKIQHQQKAGGASSINGPKAIYYTQNGEPDILFQIDTYLEKQAPLIWEKYLNRFKTNP